MARCAVCGEHDGLNNACNYCGQKHCKSHILPENHNCTGLRTGSTKTQSSNSSVTAGSSEESSGWLGSITSRDDTAPRRGGDNSPPVQVETQKTEDNAITETVKRAASTVSTAALFVVGMVLLVLSFLFSKRGLALIAVLGAALVTYSAMADTGIGIIDDTVDGAIETISPVINDVLEDSTSEPDGSDSGTNEQVEGASSGSTADSGASSNGGEPAGGIDEERTAELIHQRINEVRTEQGLSTLSFDGSLAEVAEYHSHDMLERGYFAHQSPDGEEMSDRYDRFGYDCRVSTGGNRHATGAENIFSMSATTSPTPSSIADRTVGSWMSSPGHRENILRDYWRNEGVGVAVGRSNGEYQVYVTQNFC